MSNLQIRLITAAFLIAISLTATWAGGVVFRLFILMIGAAIYYEWQILTLSRQTVISRGIGWLFYALIAGLVLAYQPEYLVFSVFLAAVLILSIIGRSQAIWQVCGLFYALAAPVTLSYLRDFMGGLDIILFLYAIVWATDSGAYFCGRAVGGAKLAPRISPNKTWSGALGGGITAILAGCLVVWTRQDLNFSLAQTILLAVVLCVVSQMGDIGESWLKRYFKAKDSGRILPGHGGFMDRADGLIVSAVVLYLIFRLDFLFYNFLFFDRV